MDTLRRTAILSCSALALGIIAPAAARAQHPDLWDDAALKAERHASRCNRALGQALDGCPIPASP